MKKDKMKYRYFDNLACKVVKSEDDDTMIFTISDETVDRYKEILKADGCELEEYQKNPVVLWAHNRNQELPPIGRALWVKKENNSVKAKVEFAPSAFAQEVAKLYKEGFMNGVSVGYIEQGRTDVSEDDDTSAKAIINKWELLEFSAVPVPANPNALMNMVEGMPELMFKDFKEWSEKKEDFCKEYISKAFPVCEISEPVIITPEETTDKTITTTTTETIEFEDAEKATKYKCECIDCGHKMTSEKHCNDLKCSKCGGQMRRQERPGPGQNDIEPTEKSLDPLEVMKNAIISGNIGKEEMIKEAEKLGLVFIEKDPNEINLDTIIDEKDVEIELDKIEGSQTQPENSGEEIKITEEQYLDLKTDIKKVVSDGFTGEFRRKILGKVDD